MAFFYRSLYTFSSGLLRHYSAPLTGFISSFSSLPQAPESIAYRRAESIRNACSFIGTIDGAVKSTYSGLRAYSFLKGKLAEISLQYLKPNDYVYVSGSLDSYVKHSASGEQHETFYKVYVQELNFVEQFDQQLVNRMDGDSVPMELIGSPTDKLRGGVIAASGRRTLNEKMQLERLHLWQLFFANPNEWWDNRGSKKTSTEPDFRHKDTKEALWLSQEDDPPWVRHQLQLHDSNKFRDPNPSHHSYDWNFTTF